MVIIVVVLAGPSFIHLGYRLATPASTRKAQAARYDFLANAEVFDKTLSDGARQRMQGERVRLFYWFHARGWKIDEGDDKTSLLKPWRELFRYWKG